MANPPLAPDRGASPDDPRSTSSFFDQAAQSGHGFASADLYTGPNGLGAVGVAKGNRSFALLPPRMALTGPGPFANLRGGVR